jgi:hypothetical protein
MTYDATSEVYTAGFKTPDVDNPLFAWALDYHVRKALALHYLATATPDQWVVVDELFQKDIELMVGSDADDVLQAKRHGEHIKPEMAWLNTYFDLNSDAIINHFGGKKVVSRCYVRYSNVYNAGLTDHFRAEWMLLDRLVDEQEVSPLLSALFNLIDLDTYIAWRTDPKRGYEYVKHYLCGDILYSLVIPQSMSFPELRTSVR